MGKQNRKVLNRDVIKYIAMITMLLNHIAHIFLPVGTPGCELLQDIGYFTAPTMCYFMVEGYAYTRSKKKYGLRLLLFALLSQIPYMMAFDFGNLNMIFTLFFCFLLLTAREKIQNRAVRGLVCAFLVLLTAFSDWAFFAPVFVLLFDRWKGDAKGVLKSYIGCYVFFAALNIISYLNNPYGLPEAIIHGALAGVGILVSALLILVFYNGKRAEHGRNFSKWFFYIFYPGHLLILVLLKMYVFV